MKALALLVLRFLVCWTLAVMLARLLVGCDDLLVPPVCGVTTSPTAQPQTYTECNEYGVCAQVLADPTPSCSYPSGTP